MQSTRVSHSLNTESTDWLRALVAGRFQREAVVHVGSVSVSQWAFGHLPRHCHADDFEPPQLELLGLGGKAVDRLGLGEPEAGRGVRGPGTVLYGVAQQGDGALGLHILRVRGSRSEHEYKYNRSQVLW